LYFDQQQRRDTSQPKKGKKWEEAFVPFPSALLREARDDSWSAVEFLVYLTIGDHVNRESGVAVLKFETLRCEVGCSRSQLYKARKALVERGVLYVGERHGEDGERLADAYRLPRPGDEEDQDVEEVSPRRQPEPVSPALDLSLTGETEVEEVSSTRPPSLTHETRLSHGGDSLYRKEPEKVSPEGPVGLSEVEPRAEASQPAAVEAETDGPSESETFQEPPIDHPHYETLALLWEIEGWIPDLDDDSQQLAEMVTGVAMGLDLVAMAWRFREYVRANPKCGQPGRVKASWWRHVAECPPHRRPEWEPPEKDDGKPDGWFWMSDAERAEWQRGEIAG
jgi:hypothetical protein